ncbi:MAG: BatD family protein [Bacteroidales bacterium]|jgi:hypothetical protein
MKNWLKYILLSFIPLTAPAQEITLTAEYPAVVTAGEQFPINFTVNAAGGEFTVPQFNNFNRIMGPQTSYSSNTQIINGRISQQTSYTYSYYLQADKKGKYVIGPASVRIKNKEYYSDSIRIEVVGEANTGNVSRPNEQVTKGNTGQQPSGSDLFIQLLPSRSEVYQGEYVVATLKLYSRVDLSGLNEIKFPDFNGFLRENLETPPLTSLQRENLNGVMYGTGVIQQFLLFPQVPGNLTIGPVEISALIQQKVGNSDPFFGDFFSSFQNVPRAIVSKPVKITVKPLPANKPDDFSGIVGKIDLIASLSRDTANVNDALNFKITINGTGNLRLAGKPSFKLSPDVEVYEPKITDNIRNASNGTSGQKTFEYVLIPRHYGNFTIPPITYTYFNPESGKYEAVFTKEFNFYARKIADQGGAVTVYGGVSKEDVKYLGKDIRFIDSSPGRLAIPDNLFISKRSFLTFYGLALLIFIAILIIRREHIRRNSDISSVKNRKAAKVAGKRLSEASKCLKSGMTDRFHEEILKALWGYLSDKLTIPVSELTRTTAVDALRRNGINEEQIEHLSSLLDKCEYARFAPSSSAAEATGIYDGAMQFIRFVENSI